jgi:phosphohistidine phosphatase
MPRQLWLLRHADAEPHGTREDSQRRLTARGEEQSLTAGAALARLGEEFDEILYSPKVRARQTIELAAQELGPEAQERMREHGPLAGGFDAARALEALSGAGGEDPLRARLLLVGHEPDFSQVVAELTGALIDLKKGGIAVVRLDGARGELVVLLRPRELALIGGVRAAAGAPAGRD